MLNCSSLVLESWAKASKSSYKRRARDLWGAAPLGTCTAHIHIDLLPVCSVTNVYVPRNVIGGGAVSSPSDTISVVLLCVTCLCFFSVGLCSPSILERVVLQQTAVLSLAAVTLGLNLGRCVYCTGR